MSRSICWPDPMEQQPAGWRGSAQYANAAVAYLLDFLLLCSDQGHATPSENSTEQSGAWDSLVYECNRPDLPERRPQGATYPEPKRPSKIAKPMGSSHPQSPDAAHSCGHLTCGVCNSLVGWRGTEPWQSREYLRILMTHLPFPMPPITAQHVIEQHFLNNDLYGSEL